MPSGSNNCILDICRSRHLSFKSGHSGSINISDCKSSRKSCGQLYQHLEQNSRNEFWLHTSLEKKTNDLLSYPRHVRWVYIWYKRFIGRAHEIQWELTIHSVMWILFFTIHGCYLNTREFCYRLRYSSRSWSSTDARLSMEQLNTICVFERFNRRISLFESAVIHSDFKEVESAVDCMVFCWNDFYKYWFAGFSKS